MESTEDVIELLEALMQSRRTVLPKRLFAPGPDAAQLKKILESAAHAPDHGKLLPWRFVLIPGSHRAELGEAFADALLERDPQASAEQQQQARDKALRAPLLLMLVVEDERGDAEVDLMERVLSAGCAIQNMLLMATALGFGSALTSGKALKSAVLRQLFRLNTHEHALCFLSVGTAVGNRHDRVRPDPGEYVSYFEGAAGAP